MKKLLLVAGILLIVLGAIVAVFALLNLTGYFRVYDGTPEFYERLHRRMVTLLCSGVGLAVIGALCVFLRSRR